MAATDPSEIDNLPSNTFCDLTRFAPFTKQRPESLRRVIEKGPIAPEYRDDARFLFCLDHQCAHNWCPNVPHVDFALVSLTSVRSEALQRPGARAAGRHSSADVPRPLQGPFFTISEAWQFAEERNRGDHNQVVMLPHVVPHVWCSDGCCSFCGESDPAQHCRFCPKRSCYTWYELLGVSKSADQSQIGDFRTPDRFQHPLKVALSLKPFRR